MGRFVTIRTWEDNNEIPRRRRMSSQWWEKALWCIQDCELSTLDRVKDGSREKAGGEVGGKD